MTAVGGQTYKYQAYQKLARNTKKKAALAVSPLFDPVSGCVATVSAE